MPKSSQFDRVLAKLTAQRDEADRLIQLLKDMQQAEVKPKAKARVGRPPKGTPASAAQQEE